MHNLRRFYYKNKDKIWKVVLIIAFLLGIIYFLNNNVIEKINDSNNGSLIIDNQIYENTETQTYIEKESAISGSIITEKEVDKINKTVNQFLQYCKNGNSQEAYDMLSVDSKENQYKTLDEFENRYMKKKYNNENVFKIEKWISDTYKITISTDMLATGEIDNVEKIEYISIVMEGQEQKLNINGYVGKSIVNKKTIQKDIEISVLEKQRYIDYEIYNFKIINLSEKKIKVDSLQKIGTMHLEDSNKIKYNAYAHELFEPNLEIKPNEEVSINIKYANPYSTRVVIKKIVFENIISDYVKYKTMQNKKEYKEICEVVIEV